MIQVIPIEGIANEEILHLCLLIVKDLGSPVRVLPQTTVRMLVAGGSVKIRQSVGILGKMCGNPV